MSITMSSRSDTYRNLLQEENPQEPGNDALSVSQAKTSRLCNKQCTQKYLPRIIASVLALAFAGCAFGLFPYIAISSAIDNNYVHFLYFAAGAFVLITVPISVYGIMQHLVNYYMPQVQKFVVRILFMVPIFSMEAWFSLFFHEAYEYIGVFRELYEAFVLSSFVYYIIALLGGEDELVTKLRRKDATYGQHPLPFKMFLGEWKMGRQFMMNCKYGVLQYVLVKIIATILIIPLQAEGHYNSGEWSWTSSYAYIAVIMNISVASALYCLVRLYYATKDDLKEWNPLGKFLCIKGIIFFTFWQGFAIQVLCSAGVIKGIGDWDPQHVVDGITDSLICFEMVFFAIAHRYAFPHTDYLHYLQRQRSKTNRSSRNDTDALLLFDQDNYVVNDSSVLDHEYQPPTVSQLDRPMSVSRALLGSAVPDETLRDIYRMGGTAAFGDASRSSAGSGDLRGRQAGADDDLLISMDQAEKI
ncbi:hypothetical protein ACHAWO_001823 [Cyclotella atomus]|uniref:Uncharacterized protein n=1 Tax=Cyclotella atomus TaxID=382360 RepID=A0ABD3MX03_9STRA